MLMQSLQKCQYWSPIGQFTDSVKFLQKSVKVCKVVNFFTDFEGSLSNLKNHFYLWNFLPLKSSIASHFSQTRRSFLSFSRMRQQTSEKLSSFLRRIFSRAIDREQSANLFYTWFNYLMSCHSWPLPHPHRLILNRSFTKVLQPRHMFFGWQ
jgi:hypothetical protein